VDDNGDILKQRINDLTAASDRKKRQSNIPVQVVKLNFQIIFIFEKMFVVCIGACEADIRGELSDVVRAVVMDKCAEDIPFNTNFLFQIHCFFPEKE